MLQLLLWRSLASALVAEGPTKWEASVSEDRKSNCCDIHTSQIFHPFLPGVELFCHFCPHLDVACATEGLQRQVGLPGEEFFGCLCPHLNKADAPECRQRHAGLPDNGKSISADGVHRVDRADRVHRAESKCVSKMR